MIVYLSGPIIRSQFRMDDFYHAIVDTLERANISVFAPQFLPKVSAKEIYERDVKHVKECKVLIAEVSNPSLGVGMELMLAIELGRPIIMFYKEGSGHLSRMVQGAPGKALITYSSIDDVIRFITDLDIQSLTLGHCNRCESGVLEKTGKDQRCIKCGNKVS